MQDTPSTPKTPDSAIKAAEEHLKQKGEWQDDSAQKEEEKQEDSPSVKDILEKDTSLSEVAPAGAPQPLNTEENTLTNNEGMQMNQQRMVISINKDDEEKNTMKTPTGMGDTLVEGETDIEQQAVMDIT